MNGATATSGQHLQEGPARGAGTVGQRIRTARHQRGMSLSDLASAGLSRSLISAVETGRSRISLRALSLIAERLDMPISYFLSEADGVPDAQVELLLDHAEAALARREPEDCLRQLDGVPADRSRPRALYLRGCALIDLGKPREALPVLQEGLTLLEGRSDPRLAVQIHYKLGGACYAAGTYEEALSHLRTAMDLAMSSPEDPIMLAKMTVALGHIQYVRGDMGSAIDYYARARQLFGQVGDLDNLGAVYSGLSLAYERLGNLPDALRYSKLSLGAYEAKQNERQAAREMNNLATRYLEIGEVDQALESAMEAVRRAQALGARDVEAFARSTLAAVYLRQERFDEAQAEACRVEELAPGGDDRAAAHAWTVLAQIAERAGDTARADDLLHRALQTLERDGHHTAFADAAITYSLLLQQRGDTEAALRYALEAAQARAARSQLAAR